MKQQSKITECEQAAKKIDVYISKEKSSPCIEKADNHKLRLKSEQKFVKLPFFLERIGRVSNESTKLNKSEPSFRQTDLLCLSSTQLPLNNQALTTEKCCRKSNYNLEFLCLHGEKSFHLSHQFTKWNLKEYSIASKNFKKLKYPSSGFHSKKHTITTLRSSDREDPSLNFEKHQREPWEDYIHSKEQRLFQIDRVIKYLID